MKIWYLYHSGFAVETRDHFLIFDYWKTEPKNGKLRDGVIDPEEIREKDVLVFVSHRHYDHYSRKILKWGDKIPKLRMILSDDIPSVAGAMMVGPEKTVDGGDFQLQTFTSTDEGTAFLLGIDGMRIYHAGDLNWWHWEGEPLPYNENMATDYRRQIGRIGPEPIDVAFVPVDPRLEDQYGWGLDHLMRTANVRFAVPMHFGEETAVVDRLLADPMAAEYREKILPITVRGQSVEIPEEE